MLFHINYWCNAAGKAPVEKYIFEIENKKEKAELLPALKGIQEYGTGAVGLDFRQLSETFANLSSAEAFNSLNPKSSLRSDFRYPPNVRRNATNKGKNGGVRKC